MKKIAMILVALLAPTAAFSDDDWEANRCANNAELKLAAEQLQKTLTKANEDESTSIEGLLSVQVEDVGSNTNCNFNSWIGDLLSGSHQDIGAAPTCGVVLRFRSDSTLKSFARFSNSFTPASNISVFLNLKPAPESEDGGLVSVGSDDTEIKTISVDFCAMKQSGRLPPIKPNLGRPAGGW